MTLFRKIWDFLFSNFMWLYIIMGLLSWVGIYPMTFQLLMFVGFLYSVTLFPKFRMRSILDLSVVIYLFYILMNSILIDYPHHFELFRNEIFFSLLPISFYYIAKSTDIDIDYYINKMILPMVIVMIIGIVLYIENPPWYSALKYAQLLDSYGYTEATVPDRMLREAFRLSSIWNTAYVIGYANGFFILYLLKRLMTDELTKSQRRITLLLFVLSFVVMILAGFKALMLAFVVSILLFFALVGDKKKKEKLIFGAVSILIVTVLIIVSFDSEYYEFFINRFQDTVSEEGLAYRLEHTGGGIELNTVFGAGYGHYGMAAKNFSNGWFIQDSQYQKVLAELGYFGFAIFIFMLLAAGFSAFNKKCILELCILATYMISFIGSSSISAETTFPFIFWYAVGRISRKTGMVSRVNAPSQVKTHI